MPTPAQIISQVASLMNDTVQSVYTNAACLPYFNIALDELQEIYQHNDIPVTHNTYDEITVPAGTTVVKYRTNNPTDPQLPAGLISIKELWERQSGVDPWIPVVKRSFIPHYLDSQPIAQFGIYAWVNNEIHVPEANQDNDLKIDGIKKIFITPLVIEQIELEIPIENVKTFLAYKTAALCSMFIGENQTRAAALDGEAVNAMDRSLGIENKAKQAIQTRRRPFRAAYKSRTNW